MLPFYIPVPIVFPDNIQYPILSFVSGFTWVGLGPDNLWSDALNWSPAMVPTGGQPVFFTNVSSKNAVLDVNSALISSISFSAGYTGNFDLSGNYLQVMGPFIYSGGGSFRGDSGTLGVSGTTVFSGNNVAPGTGTFNLSGNLIVNPTSVTSGAANFNFVDSSGIQQLTLNNFNLGTLNVNGSGVQFRSPWQANNVFIDAGLVNMGGQSGISSGAFYVSPFSNFVASGWSNSYLGVSGNLNFIGSNTNILALNPGTGWRLVVGGSANAYYVNVSGSNASGGTTIQAEFSNNLGNNINWNFLNAQTGTLYLTCKVSGDRTNISTNPFALNSNGEENDPPLNLFVLGQSPALGLPSGHVNLFMSGNPGIFNSGTLFLTVLGGYFGNPSASIPLYIANSGAQNSVYMTVVGQGTTPGALPDSGSLNLFVKNVGASGGFNCYISGLGESSGSLLLSIPNVATLINGGLNISIPKVEAPSSGSLNQFISGF